MSALPVSDNLREAAADLYLLATGNTYVAADILRGECDKGAFVQAVAKFEAETRALT